MFSVPTHKSELKNQVDVHDLFLGVQILLRSLTLNGKLPTKDKYLDVSHHIDIGWLYTIWYLLICQIIYLG